MCPVLKPTENDDNKEEAQVDDAILAQFSMELLQNTLPKHEKQILKEVYSVELEIARIYERSFHCNIRASFEEQTEMYYLAKHVFKS